MRRVLETAAAIRLVWGSFGARGVVRRTSYLVKLRTGWLRRRLPAARGFDGVPVATWSHRFDLDRIRAAYARLDDVDAIRQEIVANAARALSGEQRLYGWAWKQVGWPPRWHVGPFSGATFPDDHWSRIDDDDPARGDVKDVWELSRLPLTFLFARALAVTGDERYTQAWWEMVEDWAQHNTPNTGVNWRCGQETSLRGIALCFGLSAFADCATTTPERRELASRILGASVHRVRPSVGYALSQRNNHAISELVFLISLEGPRRRWVRLLRETLADQFAPDGSYSQQSFIYQRLAVHVLSWLLAVRDDLPSSLRRSIEDRLASSAAFLERCHEPVGGLLPNHGPVDSALLLRLDTCDERDARPTLRLLGHGAGSDRAPEVAIWFPDVVPVPMPIRLAAPTYHTMRGERSMLLTRVGRHPHRPGHDDQQAVELWLDGQPVVADPGTYRYSGRPPWRNPFVAAEAHSTILAARSDHRTIAVGRFLRSTGPPAELVSHRDGNQRELLVSRRLGEGGAWTVRAILRRADAFLVVDHVTRVDAEIRWTLPADCARSSVEGVAFPLVLRSPDGHAVALGGSSGRALVHERSQEDPTTGWAAPHYGQLVPRTVVSVHLAAGDVTACVIACSEVELADLSGCVDEVAGYARAAI